MIEIKNDYLSIYDILAFVNKLPWLLEDDYNSHDLHKLSEQEALKLIVKILPELFSIEHIESHQDNLSSYTNLSTKARLNIDTDDIVTSNATIPNNTHILTNKFTIYVNNKYAYHRIDHQIRVNSHAQKAEDFLRDKYRWNSIKFNDIDWHNYSMCLSKLSSTKKRTALIFIHHRIPTGNMQISLHHACPHCNCNFSSSTPHDHFMTCDSSAQLKHKRLKTVETALHKLHSPRATRSHLRPTKIIL